MEVSRTTYEELLGGKKKENNWNVVKHLDKTTILLEVQVMEEQTC